MLKCALRLVKLFLGMNTPSNISTRKGTPRNQPDMAYLINKYGV